MSESGGKENGVNNIHNIYKIILLSNLRLAHQIYLSCPENDISWCWIVFIIIFLSLADQKCSISVQLGVLTQHTSSTAKTHYLLEK